MDQTYNSYVAPDGTNLTGQAVATPPWSLAGTVDYLWRNVLRDDLDLTLQDAYIGTQRCNADSEVQGDPTSPRRASGASSSGRASRAAPEQS